MEMMAGRKRGVLTVRCILVLAALAWAGAEASASWRLISTERVVETNPLVVVGKITSIKVAAEEAFKDHFLDIAALSISDVLKNDLDDPNVKRGGTIPLVMPSVQNKKRFGDSIYYKEGDEGVWILEPVRAYTTYKGKKGYYEATFPGDFQPLDQAKPIAEIIAKQNAERQAALDQGALREIEAQERALEAAPQYTLEQFEADLKKTILPEVDPGSLRVGYVYGPGAVRHVGWVFVSPDGTVPMATRHRASWAGFRDGLVAVGPAAPDGKIERYGYMDRTGKLVIEPVYEHADDFSEGRAAVWKDGRCGFISTTGAVVIPLEYDEVGTFSGGICHARKGASTYLLDLQGAIVYQTQMDDFAQVSEGMLGVPGGYVDKTGRMVVDFAKVLPGVTIRQHKPFSGGYAAVRSADDLWGFVSRDGKLAIPPTFAGVGDFSEDMVSVGTGNRENDRGSGYADTSGKVVIPPAFAHAKPFHEGLAAVQMLTWTRSPHADGVIVHDLKWGYIRKDGGVAIKPVFDGAGDFHSGLAFANDRDGRYGFIDTTGRFVWSMKTR